MKTYEFVSRSFLTRRTPVIIRIDGKAFHTFTRSFDKPFDKLLTDSMVNAAVETAKNIQGFKVGYIQSDEASFCLLDTDNLDTESWFANNLSKMVSVSASLMTGYFIEEIKKTAFFDSRVFNIPPREVSNYFVWRAKDWERNSLQMYARSFFSHKEMKNKKKDDIHEMLFSIGKNWTSDIDNRSKNGTFIMNTEEGIKIKTDINPNYQEINELINSLVNLEV
jgi:tRNA(His) 5'-end guanylyltransferase